MDERMALVRRFIPKAIILSLLAVVPASAWHLDLDITCVDPTPWLKCCTAVSDSGGAGAHYVWEVTDGFGYVEPMETDGDPWTGFHCVQHNPYTEQIYNQVDGGVLYGHGGTSCHSGF